LTFYECVSSFLEQGVPVYVLQEEGISFEKSDLFQKFEQKRICFVIGDQIGFSNIDLEKLPEGIQHISLGKTSFLGSTTITLIKWILWHNQNTK
jgi:tRNA pseudouridine-54 N-methylase